MIIHLSLPDKLCFVVITSPNILFSKRQSGKWLLTTKRDIIKNGLLARYKLCGNKSNHTGSRGIFRCF